MIRVGSVHDEVPIRIEPRVTTVCPASSVSSSFFRKTASFAWVAFSLASLSSLCAQTYSVAEIASPAMITRMPGPGKDQHRGADEDDDEACDRDRDSLAVAGDEAGDDLERNDGGVVVPAPSEPRSRRLQLFDELGGVDFLRLVSPDLVPEGGSSLLGSPRAQPS